MALFTRYINLVRTLKNISDDIEKDTVDKDTDMLPNREETTPVSATVTRSSLTPQSMAHFFLTSTPLTSTPLTSTKSTKRLTHRLVAHAPNVEDAPGRDRRSVIQAGGGGGEGF